MVQIGETAAALTSPLDHLVACHRRIEQRLATFERAGAELSAQPQEAKAAIEAAIRFMDTNGARHTQDEEESIFPRLLPRLEPAARAYIEALEAQHQKAERVFEDLKLAAASLPQSLSAYTRLATELRILYREHIQSEEETLIDFARRSLSNTEIDAIAAEMSARRAERSC